MILPKQLKIRERDIAYLYRCKQFHEIEAAAWLNEFNRVEKRNRRYLMKHTARFLIREIDAEDVVRMQDHYKIYCENMCCFHSERKLALAAEIYKAKEKEGLPQDEGLIKV